MFSHRGESISIMVIMITALFGLGWMQVTWLSSAIRTNKQLLVQKMDVGAKEVAERYRDRDLSDILVALESDPDTSALLIHDGIYPIIDAVMEYNNLPESYTYGLYEHGSCGELNLVCGTTRVPMLLEKVCKRQYDRKFGWSNLTCELGYGPKHNYHLAIFPSYEEFVMEQMKQPLITFLVFLSMIIFCFYYLLRTIGRQKKLSNMKNDFINNLTHEFKTPIFTISLASKALRQSMSADDLDREAMSSYIDVMDSEGLRLKGQVDKILQLSLLDSGTQQMDLASVDVHDQLRETVDRFGIILKDREAVLEIDCEASRAIVRGDDMHLQGVWYNLMDNALKYSVGTPTIKITTRNEGNMIKVVISDRGIGMNGEQLRSIFDKFYRVPTGDLHSVKGFGVGLSYVKSVVELLDGSVGVHSELGRGSKFVISLPTHE